MRPHQLQEGILTVRTSANMITAARTLREDYMSSDMFFAARLPLSNSNPNWGGLDAKRILIWLPLQ